MFAECPDSDPPDWSIAAEVLLRQGPVEEEEDEEEEDGDDNKQSDDESFTTDDGYSE
jgi:hypothetical protein